MHYLGLLKKLPASVAAVNIEAIFTGKTVG
jgi:hypothetical protein